MSKLDNKTINVGKGKWNNANTGQTDRKGFQNKRAGNFNKFSSTGNKFSSKYDKSKKFPDKGDKFKKFPAKDDKFKKASNKSVDQMFNNQEDGKTDWIKLKSDMKTLREDRRKKKKHTFYDSYQQVKKLWEKLRNHKCKPEEREEICNQILKLIKGKIELIVKSHDMARIIQWMVKLGTDSVREEIFAELSGTIVNMSKNKYSKHTVKSILQHCSTPIKKKVIENCSGNIYGMTCSKVSAPLVEEMYKCAGPAEKKAMINKFYGGMANDINFDSNLVGDEVTTALLNKSSKFLNSLINKEHCLQLNLVHSVLYDYLQKCKPETKTEMVNNLKTNFRSFLSSKDGVKLFALILWESTTKEKKSMVKELKGDVKELAVGEYSSMALILLMDAVDDTVLIKKTIVSGLLDNLDTIVTDEHGRKVIIYLMVHRDAKHFHPKDIEWLSQLDSSPNVKKGSDVKVHEIQEALLIPILEKVTANPKFWFSNGSISMVTLAIITASSGESRKSALTSIADYIIDTNSTVIENDKVFPIIEHPSAHMVLKKIFVNDKSVQNEDEKFSTILVDKLNKAIISNWIKSNRGCFTLLSIAETQNSKAAELLKKLLSKCKGLLESEKSKGSQLLKKLITK